MEVGAATHGAEPLPLDRFLREHKDGIVDRFVAAVKRAGPEAGRSASVARIRNSLDVLIGDLSEQIARHGAGAPSAHVRAHVKSRWELGYDLRDLLYEYGFLHEAIFQELETQNGTLSAAEANAFAWCMNAAVSRAVELYVEHRDAEYAARTRELEDERERLRTMLRTLPVGVAIINRDYTVVDANEAAQRVWGGAVPVGAKLGTDKRFAAWRPDSGDEIPIEERPLVRAVGKGETVHDEELEIVTLDGRCRSLTVSASPLRDATGTVIGGVAAYVDVTEYKRLTQVYRFLSESGRALAESLDVEETLRRMTELALPTLADGCVLEMFGAKPRSAVIAHRDPAKRQRIVEIRERFENRTIVGPDPSPSMRQGKVVFATRVPPEREQEEQIEPRLRERMEAFRDVGLDSYMILPLRAQSTVLGALTLVYTGSGRCYMASDIWFAEAFAFRLAQALQNALLYADAREAARTREDVVAVVSHDLRNPLNVLMLAIGALDRAFEEPETRRELFKRKVDLMARAVGRMDRLIRDLLDLSRLQAGHFAIEPHAEQVTPMLERAYDAAVALAEPKHVHVRFDRPDGGTVACDRDRVLQVLSNLIDNAIKFTPDGGEIVIGARPQNGAFRFFVRDTGPGIQASQVPHLFDRFWQAQPGAPRSGAGLGLAIARGIVEAHGGKVDVDTAPGRGSTFWFTLPRAS